MRTNPERLKIFQREIWSYHRKNRREMPWRKDTRPYYVVVSEIMLQQTQVDRVRVKFASFVERFPDWKSLARASTREVLAEWSGLGYNRRGLYLKRIAEIVVADERYKFLLETAALRTRIGGTPQTISSKKSSRTELRTLQSSQRSRRDTCAELRSSLLELPGIGPNTAGSILTFAFNLPIPFIETNIRSVFIHFFFKDTQKKIPDSELFPLIERTIDQKNSREWYYALMDYGSYLKKLHPNPSRRSAHHIRQSSFKGSNRELRSNILKIILEKKSSASSIAKRLSSSWDRQKIEKNLADLRREGFIEKKGRVFQVAR